MDIYRRLLLTKKLIRMQARLAINNVAYSSTPSENVEKQVDPVIVTPVEESKFQPFTYTSKLVKENFMRFGKQSVMDVQHDYVFVGSERLANIDERMKEFLDPLDEKSLVNIGFDYTKKFGDLNRFKRDVKEKLKANKKAKNYHNDTLQISLEEYTKDWIEYAHFAETKSIAEHYNIFKDLYDTGYFYSYLNFPISYQADDKKQINVKYGNRISAAHTSSKPLLNLENLDPTKYYTLTFMNLDGNLKDESDQVLLWFVSNINKETNQQGDELISYLQPFPMRGTGWHRCAYVLYQHDEKIDFKSDLDRNERFLVDKRSFKTLDFYLKHQKSITPASFCFFQTEWDLSVRQVFHQVLNMKEPVYEFDFGKRFVPIQEKYPKQQVFNWYLEDYQDKKDIAEFVMKKYLPELSPFDDYPKELEYPLIESTHATNIRVPRWFGYELNHMKMREHKWSLVPFKYSAKATQSLKKPFSLPYGIDAVYTKNLEDFGAKPIDAQVSKKKDKKK